MRLVTERAVREAYTWQRGGDDLGGLELPGLDACQCAECGDIHRAVAELGGRRFCAWCLHAALKLLAEEALTDDVDEGSRA